MKRLGISAVLIGAVMLLAACAPGPEPSVTSAPPVATSTPTPTPTVDPMAVQPFGNACDNALTPDEVDSIRPVSELNAGSLQVDRASLQASGVLECLWMGNIAVRLISLPESVAAAAGMILQPAPTCMDEWRSRCLISSITDSTWVQLELLSEGVEIDDAMIGGLSSLLDVVLARLSGFPDATADVRVDAWPTPTCDAVAESIDLAGIFGEFQPGIGRDSSGISAAEQILVDAGRMSYCTWSTLLPQHGTVWIEVRVAPRAGGQSAALLPRSLFFEPFEATPITVDGATEAVSWWHQRDEGQFAGAILSDGVNRVEVVVAGGAIIDPVPVPPRLFAALAAVG